MGPSSSFISSSRVGVPITSKILISWCVSARNSSPKRSFCPFSFRLELSGKQELPVRHAASARPPGNSGCTRVLGSSVCSSSPRMQPTDHTSISAL